MIPYLIVYNEPLETSPVFYESGHFLLNCDMQIRADRFWKEYIDAL